MKMISNFFLLILSSVLLFSSSLQAAKKTFASSQEAEAYLMYHYNEACRYYNKHCWRRALNEFERVIYFGSSTLEAANAYYFLGVCLFEIEEYDFANEAFSNYLKSPGDPDFFEDVLQYKFCIAEHFKYGKKRRLLRSRYCPKWVKERLLALPIYDEIIIACPNHELAALSLYSKGCLLLSMKEYRESIEAFQMLIRRFAKHELAPQSYLNIAQAYCQQSRREFQNPDILALAEVNARRFRENFARDERVAIAEGYVHRIKEMYAKGLCDIGLFYERTRRPVAAVIYYQCAIQEFPDTRIADCCRERLYCLGCEYKEEKETACSPSTSSKEQS